jgi:ATP-binding cassette, subfamily B, bacterial PglK
MEGRHRAAQRCRPRRPTRTVGTVRREPVGRCARLGCQASADEDREPSLLTTLRQTFDLVGRDHPGRWAILVVLALVVSAFEIIGALLVYVLLALVVEPGAAVVLPLFGDLRTRFPTVDERTLLLGTVVAMAAFFLVRGVVKVGATYVQTRVAQNAGARLSNRLMEGYLRWPYAVHLQRHSSELIRNGHQAVLEMVDQLVLPLIRVMAESALVVGMLVLLSFIAPTATALAILVVGSAAGLLLLVVQPRLRRLGRMNHEASKNTLGAMQQALHGVRDIKVLAREPYFARIYGTSRLRMARARYLQLTAAQLPTIVIETALLGFILLFFTLALLRGTPTQETLSILGLFGYVGLRLQPSLRDIVVGLNSLKYSAAPLDDLHTDLERVQAIPIEEEGDPLPFSGGLRLDHVSFRYEATALDAIADVTIAIRPGEQIGVSGPTGGGKTTLVDVITGLLEPTEGRVLVDGCDLRGNERAWQRNLGIVPQMVFLTDDSLRRNIALGLPDADIDDEALRESVRLAQLEEFIRDLPDGLDTTVGERGVRVSGGQRQRIAIARALYRRPSVLVFDEGTSALDNATEAQLMSAIDGLRGKHTIILIAHRLSTVRSCDRVLFVERGRVTGVGSYEELVREHAAFRAMASVT